MGPMLFRLIPFGLLAGALSAQEAQYFQETQAPSPWLPAVELRLRADRERSETRTGEGSDWQGARLRLRWRRTWGPATFEIGSRHWLGSDDNAAARLRYDQEPSRGSALDTARLDLEATASWGFSELRLGLQDNPLITQESLWDKDLRLTGGALKAGFRSEAAGLAEAGLRVVGGRVKTFPGHDVDLAAGQLVLRGDAGPVDWTLHADRWDLRWTTEQHRFRPTPGTALGQRGRMSFDAAGAGLAWHGEVPLEVRALRQRNRDTRKDGEEFQVFLGGRTRTWWPQAGFVWQRFDAGGTPYPVAGDEWWFINAAKGPRYLLALPLPSRWLLELSYLKHTWATTGERVNRAMLTLTRRFPTAP